MNRDEVLKLFRDTGALLEGHFQLSSGLHSPQYFQCARVLQYPQYAELLCSEIARYFSKGNVGVVVSPALGGIVVGQEVGRLLGTRAIFAERSNGLLELRRGFEIQPAERALVCEDVVTTGGSMEEVMEIVRSHGGIVVGAACIVDRRGGKVRGLEGQDLFSLVAMEIETFTPDACPLCKEGQPVVKPGSRGSQR
jgi:orotate phosphoribosyltransferase